MKGDFHHNSDPEVWNSRLEELKAFKAKTGHLNVPASGDTKKLAAWLSNQKKTYRAAIEGGKRQISADRKAALDKLGVTWQFEAPAKKKAKRRRAKDGDDSSDDDFYDALEDDIPLAELASAKKKKAKGKKKQEESIAEIVAKEKKRLAIRMAASAANTPTSLCHARV